MTRALVCSALVSICVALGQGISTNNAYLPANLAAQIKTDLDVNDGCPLLADSISTSWLRLSHGDALAVRVDGHGCLSGVTNGPILLYARDGSSWRKVLDAQGNRMYTLPTRSRQWRDLEVLQHINAFITIQLIFRYDGSVYRAVSCQSVDETVGGPLHPETQKCNFERNNDR
jgi:hypothetical protein